MSVNRRELIERGARLRFAEIEAERDELLEMFPTLQPQPEEPEPEPTPRKAWTAARRKAQSKLLKAIHRRKRAAQTQ